MLQSEMLRNYPPLNGVMQLSDPDSGSDLLVWCGSTKD